MNTLDVDAINRQEGKALLSNGIVTDITNWFDADGDECEPGEAITCVCGSDEQGWHTIDLSGYTVPAVH